MEKNTETPARRRRRTIEERIAELQAKHVQQLARRRATLQKRLVEVQRQRDVATERLQRAEAALAELQAELDEIPAPSED